jgi:hypothetical protein
MIQRTLEEVRAIAMDEIKEYLPQPKAKPRDPETAESLHEWCKLYQVSYGQHPDARDQLKELDRHPDWSDGFYKAKRRYKEGKR